jgi:uncharacterized protein (DUF58 family)
VSLLTQDLWSELTPLRIRARQVAHGVYAGAHRSALRGAGIEFGGYREYVPGDDLRWLDRRSLMRHQHLLVRQFETETDRTLSLVVDASASMGFRGPGAPASKMAFTSLLAAALARVALRVGDPVSLTFLGGTDAQPVGRSSSREQFERIVGALDTVRPGGDAAVDRAMVERAVAWLDRSVRRGSIVVVLSDLIDLPEDAADRLTGLVSSGRVLVVVQTLSPAEADFPFSGPVRLRSLEGGAVVETDAEGARERYLAALAAHTATWHAAIVARGARFVPCRTSDPPLRVLRDIVRAVR